MSHKSPSAIFLRKEASAMGRFIWQAGPVVRVVAGTRETRQPADVFPAAFCAVTTPRRRVPKGDQPWQRNDDDVNHAARRQDMSTRFSRLATIPVVAVSRKFSASICP